MGIIKFNNGLERWYVQILQSINYLSPQKNLATENDISNVSASLTTQTQENETKNPARHRLVETKQALQ